MVFKSCLLHHLPRDQGDFYHAVVPQILLPALEDRTMTLQKQCPVDDISQLPQYLWMFHGTSALVVISSKL